MFHTCQANAQTTVLTRSDSFTSCAICVTWRVSSLSSSLLSSMHDLNTIFNSSLSIVPLPSKESRLFLKLPYSRFLRNASGRKFFIRNFSNLIHAIQRHHNKIKHPKLV
eukprot:sb/3477360/